jgi:hypothetical protein
MNKGTLDLDPSRYEAMTSTPPELVADILAVAHSAYLSTVTSPGAQAANVKYADVKSAPYCLQVSNHITGGLDTLDKGYQTSTAGRYFLPNQIVHFVSEIKTPEMEEPIIADATWQQFFPKRGFGLRLGEKFWSTPPEVLIGTPQEVARVAMHFGFSQEQAQTWTPRPIPMGQ